MADLKLVYQEYSISVKLHVFYFILLKCLLVLSFFSCEYLGKAFHLMFNIVDSIIQRTNFFLIPSSHLSVLTSQSTTERASDVVLPCLIYFVFWCDIFSGFCIWIVHLCNTGSWKLCNVQICIIYH